MEEVNQVNEQQYEDVMEEVNQVNEQQYEDSHKYDCDLVIGDRVLSRRPPKRKNRNSNEEGSMQSRSKRLRWGEKDNIADEEEFVSRVKT